MFEMQKDYGGRVLSFMGHIDLINWDEKWIAREVSRKENVFKTGWLIVGSTCGLSIKTVSNKLGKLYPQTRGQEA
jgi:hypothetical protein